MLTRILTVLALSVCLLTLPGCLDEEERGNVEAAQVWLNAVAQDEGDLLIVHRADVETHSGTLGTLLERDGKDWSGLEALLAAIGVSGVGGIVATVKKLFKWRTIAHEAITGMEEGKVGNTTGTYTIDKSKARRAMSSATVQEIEKVRHKINQKLLVAAQASAIRTAMEKTIADEHGPGPSTSTGG